MGTKRRGANGGPDDCAQGKQEKRGGSGQSDSVTGFAAGAQGSKSHPREGRKRKDMMIRLPLGVAVLRDPAFNKGSAFTDEERDALGIRGLLPPRVLTIEGQLVQALGNVRRSATDLDRISFLRVFKIAT